MNRAPNGIGDSITTPDRRGTPLASHDLKQLLLAGDVGFWDLLKTAPEHATASGERVAVNTVRKRALKTELAPPYNSPYNTGSLDRDRGRG